jgi:hypothetical protein
VAALAVGEVLTAESSFTIVAAHAALGARRGFMLRWLRGGNRRRASPDAVTLRAVETLLATVFRVAEVYPEGSCRLPSHAIRVFSVTGSARGYIAPARLRLRRVALVTGLVGRNARWYR